MVPNGWEMLSLSDVVEFLDRKRVPIKASERSARSGPYRYYGASGVIDYVDDYIFDDDLILLAEDGANILSRSTPLAFKVSGRIWVNNHAHVMKPKPGFDIDYLVEHLESLDYAPFNSGTAQPKLNRETCENIPIKAPTFKEQEIIGRIAVTWDRSVELLEQLVTEKGKRKQALMQQLLSGEVRLHAFARRKVVNPRHVVCVPTAVRRGIYPPSVQPGIPKLIEKPDGWDEKTMAELLKTEKRRVQLDDDTEYELVVAKRNRGGIEPRGKLLGKDIRTSTQFKVKAGDFVISRRQIVHGACGIVPDSLDGAIVSNEYSVFTVNEHLDPGYLRLLSHSLYFQQTCFHSSVGVAVEKMIFKVEQWLKYPFLLPPIEEQRAITKTLETAEAEIALLQQRVEKLKRQKKGLMQQLLTGKTRVKLPKGAA